MSNLDGNPLANLIGFIGLNLDFHNSPGVEMFVRPGRAGLAFLPASLPNQAINLFGVMQIPTEGSKNIINPFEGKDRKRLNPIKEILNRCTKTN